MKKTKIAYWIFTILIGAFMLFSAIPDIIVVPQAIDIVTKHLGYPVYFIRFIGVAKLLGVVAILIPGFPRLKEWAYAGLAYDLIGAIYSSSSVGDPASAWIFIILPLAVLFCSYFFYHKLKAGSLNYTK